MDRQQETTRFCEQAEQYMQGNIRKLIEIYSGRYVIIYENRVVDSDLDEFELAKRHEGRHKFDFAHMAVILHIPETIEQYEASRKKDRIETKGFDSPFFAGPEQ